MGSQKALISVIVPIYKVERWLRQCVESIQHQTYKELEIILVDDGSPDACGRICDEMAQTDDRIVVIHKSNGGLSEARNYGLDRASGAYFAFVDSDDYLEPNMLEILIKDLKKEDADMAVCNCRRESEDGLRDPQSMYDYRIANRQILTGKEFILLEEKKHLFCIVVWNKLYRRELWEKIRFPVGKVHEDEYVFHRIADQCSRIVCDPLIGYHYRTRSESIMSHGFNYQDLLEGMLDHCWYFIHKPDQELALREERKIRHIARTVGLPKDSRDKCMGMEKELRRKGWISKLDFVVGWLVFFSPGKTKEIFYKCVKKPLKSWLVQRPALYRLFQSLRGRR